MGAIWASYHFFTQKYTGSIDFMNKNLSQNKRSATEVARRHYIKKMKQDAWLSGKREAASLIRYYK